jgi:hypothetical protein
MPNDKSLYLISPDSPVPLHFEADVLRGGGLRPAAFTANLALPTIAALAPPDFEVRLCDERIQAIDFAQSAPHVLITCNSLQYARTREIASEFRGRGRTVIVGGPFGTMVPEALRPFCDVLVRGELEPIAGEFFADLCAGRLKDAYFGEAADMERSPIPRWDLYPNDRAFAAAVQTTRGCPYDCTFCEVIKMYGRNPRMKSVPQVIAELDEVYRRGYRAAFLTDDNFASVPRRAKELLRAIAVWNRARKAGRMQFITQMSLQSAADPELLSLCAAAGLVHVAIGIETPTREGLLEANKRSNMHVDLIEGVRAFNAQGINIIAFMIAGFDSDGPDIFARHERFMAEVPIPISRTGPLVLMRGTPLYEKFEREGRLSYEGFSPSLPWRTNIIPARMTREQLLGGLQSMSERVYAAEAFTARFEGLLTLAAAAGNALYAEPGELKRPPHSAERDCWTLVERELAADPALARLKTTLARSDVAHPERAVWARTIIFMFLQMRYMFSGAHVPAGCASGH